MASIGAFGDNAHNSRRDLLRRFCSSSTVPAPISVDVESLNKIQEVEVTQQSVLSPPEVLEAMCTHHRNKMYDDFLGRNPRAFWEACRPDDPKFANMHAPSNVLGYR